MEPPAASTIDAAWFSARDCCDSDDDDDDGDDEAQRAVAMRDAALCIAAVTQLLRERQCPAAAEAPLLVVLDNCVRLWRAKFGTWHAPCGNHLNVLDMLFVAACHLRVALNPAAVVAVDTDDVVALQARIVTALKEWDRAPASIHAEHRSIVRACECAVVVWGSNVAPTTRLADTTLSLEDVSLLTMNVNVHQNLDNRARNTDLPVVAAVETTVALDNNHDAAADDERVLANFVRLASRYAFFAMLHHAALLPCAQPRLLCHQQLAAHAARPPAAVVEANVARLHALLAERSLINMPESMQRNVNYTIWKRLLSVGSMEVRRACVCVRTWQTGIPTHGTDDCVAQAKPGDCLDSRANSGHCARFAGAHRCRYRLPRHGNGSRMARAPKTMPPRSVEPRALASNVHRN